MDLTQLANLGEFIGGVGSVVGGIAVLVTLIYLSLQVRHSGRVAESSMHYQTLSITNDHFMRPVIVNREFADFVRTGRDTPESLDETDWERFVLHAYQGFGVWEAAYLNYREGVISENLWQAWDGAGRNLWCGNGYRRFWEQQRAGHARAFQEYVDHEIFPPDASS